jgi:hypothetical protein
MRYTLSYIDKRRGGVGGIGHGFSDYSVIFRETFIQSLRKSYGNPSIDYLSISGLLIITISVS